VSAPSPKLRVMSTASTLPHAAGGGGSTAGGGRRRRRLNVSSDALLHTRGASLIQSADGDVETLVKLRKKLKRLEKEVGEALLASGRCSVRGDDCECVEDGEEDSDGDETEVIVDAECTRCRCGIFGACETCREFNEPDPPDGVNTCATCEGLLCEECDTVELPTMRRSPLRRRGLQEDDKVWKSDPVRGLHRRWLRLRGRVGRRLLDMQGMGGEG
jgi:hypothetical protein